MPEDLLKIGVGHLFATGNRPGRDRIFHVAGMRYSGQDDPEKQDWIINPGRRLTRRTYEQSRVGKKLFEEKPSWEKEGPKITNFFVGLDVLFLYSQDNQREWFKKVVFKGKPQTKRPVIVDLLEMTRFFLPGLEKTEALDTKTLIELSILKGEWEPDNPRLPYLVRSLGTLLQDIVSRIRSESQSTPDLIYSLLRKALSEKPPRRFQDFDALFQVAGMAHQIRWESDLFAKRYGDKVPDIVQDRDLLSDLLSQEVRAAAARSAMGTSPRTEETPDSKAHWEDEHMRPSQTVINLQLMDEAFALLINETKGFRARSEQRGFAHFCANAINEGGMYAIEAGTGTGKTFGYLVPACECFRQGRALEARGLKVGKIIISTATKNLQDQLLETEWPRLTGRGSLYQDLKAATLKGKNNFLCMTAVVDLFEEVCRPPSPTQQKRLGNVSPDILARKRLAWLFLFIVLIHNRGETENIPWIFFRGRFPDLNDFLDEVNAAVACVPGLCRMGTSCIYPRHLQKARGADIVVTNHHKLPRMDSHIQELAQVCLIDEADQFPDDLRSATATTLSSYDIRRKILWRIRGSKGRRGFAQILEDRFTKSLQPDGKKIADDDTLKKAVSNLQSIRAACEEIGILIDDIGGLSKDYPGDRTRRWITMHPSTGEYFQTHLSSLATHCNKIAENWDSLLNSSLYKNPVNKREQHEKSAHHKIYPVRKGYRPECLGNRKRLLLGRCRAYLLLREQGMDLGKDPLRYLGSAERNMLQALCDHPFLPRRHCS